MAQIAPNPRQQVLHMSQVLPTVKCSSCNSPVPLDQLSDHVCPPSLPRSHPSSSETQPIPPPQIFHTAPPHPNAAQISQKYTRSPVVIPSMNPPAIRRQDSARLGMSPNPAPSRGVPSFAPSRNGVRSPALPNLTIPPSRTQSPYTPTSSAHQLTPRHSERDPGVLPGSPQLGRVQAWSNAPTPPILDPRSPGQRRPSSPLSPPAHGFLGPHGPRPGVASLTASNHAPQHTINPQVDTKSGGVAGMAGVGRRGFAAAARAAMFVASPMPRMHSPAPMSPGPAPRNPASSSSRAMNGMQLGAPPMEVVNPSAGTSSCIHFTFIRS
jgi:PDZ and LIM domain protein 5/6/7